MNLTTFLATIIFGTLTGNVMLSSGIGLDLASNNLNSIRNSLVFGLYVVAITFVSGLLMWLVNLWVSSGFVILVGFMIVAILVQIAELIMIKLSPIVYTHVKEMLVVLIPTISIILFSLIGYASFWLFLFNLIFVCVGMIGVLVTISGVRQNKLTHTTYDVFRGNLMTLVVLFVMALVWTAI